MDLSKHLDNARQAVQRRNYASAVALYGRLLALQPDSGEARAGLREALFKKAAQKPPSKLVAMVGGGIHLLVAAIAQACRSHAAAAKAYERYLALDPLNEGVNLRLAVALERAGFTSSALAVYQAWAEQQPRCVVASRRAGALLYERGEHAGALAMYEQALKVDPRDQESLRARKNLAAEGALRSSGLADAEHSRDLMRDKSQQLKLDRADRLQLSPEEIEEELDELEGRLAESPDDVKVLLRLAQVHEMKGDQQSALDCLERAAQLRPDDSDVAARVGDLRLRQQEARVQAAEERGDESAAAIARTALAEMQAAEYRRRVSLHPTDLGLRFGLGDALLRCGQLDEAIAELQQAVKDPRKRTAALVALGRAFRRKGLADLAKAQLEKALETTSAGTAAGKEVLYELGTVAEDGGDQGAALDYYSRILEQDIGFRDVAARVESLRAG